MFKRIDDWRIPLEFVFAAWQPAGEPDRPNTQDEET
jgi:hypothetical protein